MALGRARSASLYSECLGPLGQQLSDLSHLVKDVVRMRGGESDRKNVRSTGFMKVIYYRKEQALTFQMCAFLRRME